MLAATLALTLATAAVQADGPPLVGTPWAAVELAGVAVPGEPAARQPTIEFVANGRVAGRDGCNRFSGPYTRAGERLTFGELALTRMACPGTEEITRRFAGAMKGTSRFRISGGRLELYGATGRPLAIFASREAPAPAPPAPPKAMLKSQIFEWGSLTPTPIPNGERRQVVDGATPTIDLLHVHVTSLAVGQVSGEAVRHPRDEVLIVKEGEVEVSLDGTTKVVGPGAILVFMSGAVTRLKNVGATPATYYVTYWETPKTPAR
jgi:heat shock protein HslJ/quercetin dioxygenase-like cupin family protein